jgi:hypothetical protein
VQRIYLFIGGIQTTMPSKGIKRFKMAAPPMVTKASFNTKESRIFHSYLSTQTKRPNMVALIAMA